MEFDGLIPDVLDAAPTVKCTVIYPGNKKVDFGKELTPTDVKLTPEVKWDSNPENYYTLSMIDPDAPSRENASNRSILHWLVVNIKGNDILTGQTITSYRGSRPSKGNGLHRYIFIIFEQKNKINVTEENMETDRRKFSLRKFAEKYDLGNAFAGNYYNAQWDSSVPERKH